MPRTTKKPRAKKSAAASVPAVKRPVGRPTKYRPEMTGQAYKLCLLGATDAEMARFFGVSEVTLNAWKKDFPEFLEATQEGKIIADAEIAHSLYQRAKGYSHQAVKVFLGKDQKPIYAPYTEHYPPDTTAALVWLKNRQKDRWRERKEIDVSGSLEHKIATMTDAELDVWSRDLAARAQAILESPVIEHEAFEVEPDEGGEDPASGASEEP